LIERMIDGQFNGDIRFDWREEEIVCR